MIKLRTLIENTKSDINKFIYDLNHNLHEDIYNGMSFDDYIYRGIINYDKKKDFIKSPFNYYNIRKNRRPRDGETKIDFLVEIYRKIYFPELPSRHEILFCSMDLKIAKKYSNNIFYIFPNKNCTLYSFPYDSIDAYQNESMKDITEYYSNNITQIIEKEMEYKPQYFKLFSFMLENLNLGYVKSNVINYETDFPLLLKLCNKYFSEKNANNIIKEYCEIILDGFNELRVKYFLKISEPNKISISAEELWITNGSYYAVNMKWFDKTIEFDKKERKFILKT